LGLSLVKKGEKEVGIKHLETAIQLAKNDFLDPYYDLALVYYQHNEYKKAMEVLDKGRNKSRDFIETSDELYDLILQELNGVKA